MKWLISFLNWRRNVYAVRGDNMITQTTQDYVVKKVKENERVDGRKLDEYREIKIEYGVSENAEGSAKVSIGKTEVIVGIKMAPGEPYSDKPDEGVIITSCEFLPVAAPEYEPGPPKENEIELGRVIDRGIREGKIIDMKQLAIVPEEKVWTIFMDIYVLNDDGNLFDAAAIASMAALNNTMMPKLDENYELTEEKDKLLPLTGSVISLTAYKIRDKIILDPTHTEEAVVDARLTVGVRNDGKIVSLQKGMKGAWKQDEIINVLELLRRKSMELQKKYFKN